MIRDKVLAKKESFAANYCIASCMRRFGPGDEWVLELRPVLGTWQHFACGLGSKLYALIERLG